MDIVSNDLDIIKVAIKKYAYSSFRKLNFSKNLIYQKMSRACLRIFQSLFFRIPNKDQ